MLEVKNLSVKIGDKLVIKDLSLEVREGEIMVLFGPNGSGKTTLVKTIMGFEGYNIEKGEIVFKGKRINGLPMEERVKLGIGIMHQHPAKIRGVKLHQIAKFLCGDEGKVKKLMETLSLTEHINRDLNIGFSGGEMKRAELLQIVLQEPHFLLMDEPESGVDMENIAIMGKIMNDYFKNKDKSALIITHTGYILEYLSANKGCVMIDGKLWCMGEPKEIFESIKKMGYLKCKECHEPQRI
ncbi:MAG: ATP-binding cassette domain-containing protein [Candidatus Omnitrophica bacterium]|nr:ATP-binding cassette domain-containing protein [Candidatus Omnitrophota bacterium]